LSSQDYSAHIVKKMNSDKKIQISDFLNLASGIPVIDVRSPSEFKSGHIPGAHNIPLFDDKEREAVGISYKKEGRSRAILKGLQMTGPSMYLKLEEALKLAKENELLVHCWRGGMRSEAMAWLFSLGDIETMVLDGGYKSYRHYILERLSEKRKYIVLGGLTGSGKTEILKDMKSSGHQVIDLEGIACHKGSAFGSLGQPGQPTSEHFANLLYHELEKTDRSREIWLEDESKNIGTVFMPDLFFNNLRDAPVIVLLMDVKTRMPRLLKEYSTYSKADLISSISRIAKRLGGDFTSEAVKSVEVDNFARAIEITLNYYDKTYKFGLKKRPEEQIQYIQTDTDNIEMNISEILKASGKINF
jgi:tRNA 2-selenouridine synthase